MADIQYIDRYSGKLLTEEVPSVGVMNFIYGKINSFHDNNMRSLFKWLTRQGQN